MPSLPDQKLPPGFIFREYQQQKKIGFLEKIVQFNILVNLILGALILFVVIFIVFWRLDLINYFSKKSGTNSLASENIKKTKERVIIASENELDPIFINEQSIDIEKAFKIAPSNIHLTTSGQLKKEVFGFLPYWVMPKLDEINTKLLTSVSYFGLDTDKNGNIIKKDSDGSVVKPWFYFQSTPIFGSFIQKAHRQKIKVLVTIKCFVQSDIVNLVSSQKARDNFINNAIFLVESKNLDGVNIDFEYIGEPPKEITDGFSILVMDLNKKIKSTHPNAILTIDTFVDGASNTRLHDPALLAQHSDALVIMGYDFHTPKSTSAGPIAPMEGYGDSLVGFMSSYLEKVPKEKLILAVPYYGYDWPVDSADRNAQVAGDSANVKILPYAEIADAIKNTQVQWDENAQTPWYSYKEGGTTRVVHFENTRSLGVKYDFINQKDLKGVGIWALGFDGKREELLQLISDKFAK